MLTEAPSGSEELVADGATYRVVVNAFAQYALWLLDEPLPRGWFDCRVAGDKAHCLAHVNEVWTELRAAAEPSISDVCPGAPGDPAVTSVIEAALPNSAR